MTPEEYAAAQGVISAAAANYVMRFSTFFSEPQLSTVQWLGLLQTVYPQVSRFREESSALARTFYDQQRAFYYPDLPRHDRLVEPYEFKWFVKSMEPVRKQVQQPYSPPAVMARFTLQVVREVENAGRRQIIHAVETDEPVAEAVEAYNALPRVEQRKVTDVRPSQEDVKAKLERLISETAGRPEVVRPSPKAVTTESRIVQGWARVATGRETCEWCLMLVSRGAVYKTARSAGLKLDDNTASDAYLSGTDAQDYMNEWHTGCDCKVVPVFDLENWVGKDAADRALELWIQAGRKADVVLADDPDKKYFSHKEGRWVKTTVNRETINQLRKMVESGEISSQEWAVLQAA